MPDPADPAFWTVYAGLVKGRKPLPTGRSFKALIQSYERSERFKRLKPRTQQDYGRILAWIENTLGQLPSDKMQRKDVIRAQNESAKGVRFANYIVQILRVLFEHAIDIGWRDDNPAKGVRLLKTEKKAPHVPWKPPSIGAKTQAHWNYRYSKSGFVLVKGPEIGRRSFGKISTVWAFGIDKEKLVGGFTFLAQQECRNS